MTIKGAKTLLKKESSINLDDSVKNIVTTHVLEKDKIKEKINKISKIINELKKLKNG